MSSQHKYTEKQKQWLFENVQGTGLEELAQKFNERFGTNITATKMRGFKQYYKINAGSRYRYTKEQIDFIKDNVKGISNEELTERFNKRFGTNLTPLQIKGYRNKHGVTSGLREKFTNEQKIWIIDHIDCGNSKVIAQMFNETFGTNFNNRSILRIIQESGYRSFTPHKFSKKQNEWFKQNAHDITYEQLTEKFNNTFNTDLNKSQIRHKIVRLGLQKGIVLADEYPCKPHPLFAEVERTGGYTYIKIAEPDVWVLKHRYVYEKEIGEIPEGYIVMFLDGNKKNIVKENLCLAKIRPHAIASVQGLFCDDVEINKTALLIGEVIDESAKRKI